MYYNYFRDYDPQIGRYTESDPVGIWGGLNTYAYVANGPLIYFDPTGENIHGNWCGPGGDGPMQDGVDQCCKDHDACYDGCKADWKKVCSCLDTIRPKNDGERRGKERVSWFFKCMRLPTANQKPRQPSSKL